ncbi:hypothetical protein Pelo_14274 [Pelomyxa schiedti]|nr:hypothetical protein Pelo_14274 [Pelomyxa schiedti]
MTTTTTTTTTITATTAAAAPPTLHPPPPPPPVANPDTDGGTAAAETAAVLRPPVGSSTSLQAPPPPPPPAAAAAETAAPQEQHHGTEEEKEEAPRGVVVAVAVNSPTTTITTAAATNKTEKEDDGVVAAQGGNVNWNSDGGGGMGGCGIISALPPLLHRPHHASLSALPPLCSTVAASTASGTGTGTDTGTITISAVPGGDCDGGVGSVVVPSTPGSITSAASGGCATPGSMTSLPSFSQITACGSAVISARGERKRAPSGTLGYGMNRDEYAADEENDEEDSAGSSGSAGYSGSESDSDGGFGVVVSIHHTSRPRAKNTLRRGGFGLGANSCNFEGMQNSMYPPINMQIPPPRMLGIPPQKQLEPLLGINSSRQQLQNNSLPPLMVPQVPQRPHPQPSTSVVPLPSLQSLTHSQNSFPLPTVSPNLNECPKISQPLQEHPNQAQYPQQTTSQLGQYSAHHLPPLLCGPPNIPNLSRSKPISQQGSNSLPPLRIPSFPVSLQSPPPHIQAIPSIPHPPITFSQSPLIDVCTPLIPYPGDGNPPSSAELQPPTRKRRKKEGDGTPNPPCIHCGVESAWRHDKRRFWCKQCRKSFTPRFSTSASSTLVSTSAPTTTSPPPSCKSGSIPAVTTQPPPPTTAVIPPQQPMHTRKSSARSSSGRTSRQKVSSSKRGGHSNNTSSPPIIVEVQQDDHHNIHPITPCPPLPSVLPPPQGFVQFPQLQIGGGGGTIPANHPFVPVNISLPPPTALPPLVSSSTVPVPPIKNGDHHKKS